MVNDQTKDELGLHPVSPSERAAEQDIMAATVAAEHRLRNQAETQRDISLNLAADQAVQRDIMASEATIEALRRQEAESRELDADLAAHRAASAAAVLATERNMLREDLASERESNATANFGFVLLTCLVLAALLGFGIYSYFGQNNANNSNMAMNTSPPVRPTTVVQPPTSPPVVIPAPNVTVQPAPAPNVNVIVPSPASPSPEAGASRNPVVHAMGDRPVGQGNTTEPVGTAGSGVENGATGSASGTGTGGASDAGPPTGTSGADSSSGTAPGAGAGSTGSTGQ